MTEIEAIERVLAGDPFIECPKCEGKGNTKKSVKAYNRALATYNAHHHDKKWNGRGPPYPPPATKDYYELCMRCKGVLKVVDPTYAEACEVLGREVPTPKIEYCDVVKSIQKKAFKSVQEMMVHVGKLK